MYCSEPACHLSPIQSTLFTECQLYTRTGKPGLLQSTGLQRVGRDWATELNCTPGIIWQSEDLFIYQQNVLSNVENLLWFAIIFQIKLTNFSMTHMYLPTSLNLYFALWTPCPANLFSSLGIPCHFSPSYKLLHSFTLVQTILIHFTIISVQYFRLISKSPTLGNMSGQSHPDLVMWNFSLHPLFVSVITVM